MRLITRRRVRDLEFAALELAQLREAHAKTLADHKKDMLGAAAEIRHLTDTRAHAIEELNGLVSQCRERNALLCAEKAEAETHRDNLRKQLDEAEAALATVPDRQEVYLLRRALADHADRLAEATAADQAKDAPLLPVEPDEVTAP